MSADTVHASAVVIDGAGVIILGPSGSGKSALALDLIDHCQLRGLAAALIGDDRIVLALRDGVVFASPAPALAGLIEVRGSGIHAIDHVAQAPLHLAVRLVGDEHALRMAPDGTFEIEPGIALPSLALPRGYGALRAVLAHLGLYGGINRLLK
jgi:HPr kinase/phosphorylase